MFLAGLHELWDIYIYQFKTWMKSLCFSSPCQKWHKLWFFIWQTGTPRWAKRSFLLFCKKKWHPTSTYSDINPNFDSQKFYSEDSVYIILAWLVFSFNYITKYWSHITRLGIALHHYCFQLPVKFCNCFFFITIQCNNTRMFIHAWYLKALETNELRNLESKLKRFDWTRSGKWVLTWFISITLNRETSTAIIAFAESRILWRHKSMNAIYDVATKIYLQHDT